MLTVRLQVLFLIKERSSHPLEGHPLVTHPSLHIGPASSLLLLIHHLSQGPHLILEVCFHTTHIGFHCIQCVVIIICLLSLSENPCLLISPFKPYLSDPPTLLFDYSSLSRRDCPLVLDSHEFIVVLGTLGRLSQYLVTVTHHKSPQLVV